MKMRLHRRALLLALLMVGSCSKENGVTNLPPATQKHPVVDTYHAIQVTDDYRWLENWDKPEVKDWSDKQNGYARSVLDRLEYRDALRARITELRNFKSQFYNSLVFRNGKLFTLKTEPPKQQPFLIVMDSPDDTQSSRIVADPNTIDPSGSTAIDFYRPSFDAKLVAVSLSKGGSESGDIHVFDVATGKEVYESVQRVNGGTGGGDVAWNADASGFFYTHYPREGERPASDLAFYQQVFFHKLGTSPTADSYELGKDFPKVAEIRLQSEPTQATVLASVQHGDGGGVEHYVRQRNGEWKRMASIEDRIAWVVFGSQNDFYLVSRKNVPRGAILRVAVGSVNLDQAQVVVPESADAITSDFFGYNANFVATKSRLFVPYQNGGPMVLRAYDLNGKPQDSPQLLPTSAILNITGIGDDVLILNESYTVPPAWYRFDSKTRQIAKTAMANSSPVDFSDIEVVQDTAVSKDGTRVPFTIVRPKGTAGQAMPIIASGYGGYGFDTRPFFDAVSHVPLENGVALVNAVIRGGGEFGEDWHEQGRLGKKQNVFDDFAAVLQCLIDRKYTTVDKLSIVGGSNGGLLMGAVFTQHPELMRAVVSYVGIYDMLRVELSPNGSFNIPEFGTVTDPDLFKALYAYSPYHHVKDGTNYPSILFLTGANDPRVDPMQSRKMTARLQASRTTRPVLLRTSGETGHGIGTPLKEQVEEEVDVYTFLFHELNVRLRSGS